MSQLINIAVAATVILGLKSTASEKIPEQPHRPSSDKTLVRNLDKGTMCLSPGVETRITTKHGDVVVGKGSLVLAIVTDQTFSVYNMMATKPMLLEIPSGSIQIRPGFCAVFTKESPRAFGELNPAPFVEYRKLSDQAMGDSHWLYQAEFSVLDMINAVPQIRKLVHEAGFEPKLKAQCAKRETKSTECFRYYFSSDFSKKLKRHH